MRDAWEPVENRYEKSRSWFTKLFVNSNGDPGVLFTTVLTAFASLGAVWLTNHHQESMAKEQNRLERLKIMLQEVPKSYSDLTTCSSELQEAIDKLGVDFDVSIVSKNVDSNLDANTAALRRTLTACFRSVALGEMLLGIMGSRKRYSGAAARVALLKFQMEIQNELRSRDNKRQGSADNLLTPVLQRVFGPVRADLTRLTALLPENVNE